MLIKGACVFSPIHGHGQVVEPGDPPLVRLLSGHEMHIAADNLRQVSIEDFEALLARQTQFEHALAARVWGRMADLTPLWIKDEDDLWITPERLAEKRRQRPGPMEYFLPDDLGEQVRVLEPSEFRSDAIACRVRRVPQSA